MSPPSWKSQILSLLDERDAIQCHPFQGIIGDYNKLSDRNSQLSHDSDIIKSELRALRQENVDLSVKLEKSNTLKSYDHEQKLFRLQEEVTELHRQKGSLAGDVIELNKTVQEKDKLIGSQLAKINDLDSNSKKMQAANVNLLEEIHTLEKSNKLLHEEKAAACDALENLKLKTFELEDDKSKLIERMNKLQSVVEQLKNIEHDVKYRKAQEDIRKQLEEAASIPVEANEASASTCVQTATVPRVKVAELAANEGEVSGVRFTPSGKRFGSAGFDRKLRLWSVADGKCELRATLVGCNAAVTAIDFDPNESVVLGASSDFSCRVWTLSDSRLRVNLTGHAERVVSAKFMGSSKAIVTVSSDRTIKLWDVDRCQCKRTILTSSSPQDVIYNPHIGAVITGHFDHKLRIWDERMGSSVDTITASARITGLDISQDCSEILVCSRSDCLEVFGIRSKQLVQQLTADEFQVGLDTVRPCFSPDSQYAAAGGQNGVVYVWNVATGEVEQCLRGHSNTVVCCHWNPKGRSLVSCERTKKAIVWADA